VPSLVELLTEASHRDASEVVMETGQPVILNTPQGSVPFGSPMSEDDLFGALTSVLSEEQQVELAVGNVVEFQLDARGDWHVLTEPGMDGISVRARAAGSAAASPAAGGAPPAIDLPPVAPFSGANSTLPPVAEDSFSRIPVDRGSSPGVVDPGLAQEFASPPPAPDLGGIAPPPMASDSFASMPVGTTRDLGPRVDAFAASPATPEPAIEHPPPIELPSADPDVSTADDNPLAVSDDDEDLPLDMDFGMVETTREGLPPVTPPLDAPPLLSPEEDAPEPRKRSDSSTRLDLVPPPPSPLSDTRSDLASVSDRAPPVSGTFDEVAVQIPRHGVCFVHNADPKGVAARLGVQNVRIAHGTDPAAAAASMHALARGACAVVEVEDPSVWLGWVLRRVEEGYFVLVATRATTSGGAKRMMLGPTATVRAESWLSRHTIRSLIETEGVWSLVLPH
jgi:hypothetical protein